MRLRTAVLVPLELARCRPLPGSAADVNDTHDLGGLIEGRSSQLLSGIASGVARARFG
jgi:hypothetical protein